MADAPAMNELLGADAPNNWGKWGPDDELGALNYLDAKEVLRGRPAHPHRRRLHPADPDGPHRRPRRPAVAGPLRHRAAERAGRGHLGRRRRARRSPAACTTPTTPPDLPAGLDAVRRAGPRLVRRQALERLRRPRHRRRDGQGLRAADRREGRGRAGGADRHGPAPRQGLAGQGRDVRPHRPGGRGRRPGRDHRAARHPLHPHRLDEVLVRAQRQGEVLRRLQRARADLLPRAGRVVPAARGAQPGHRHHRQRGDLRTRSPGWRCRCTAR